MRIRNVVSIEENPAAPDSTLLWYSRAIGAMRTQRKFTDPTSWRFQSAIHDYDPSSDPYSDPKDPPPAESILRDYARQCQHSSWFFLPWHRMYLHYFEQMVADAVVAAGGPKDWALPYWNYTDNPAARKLPWAFRQPAWPGGETNYLYVAERADGINAGKTSLSDRDTNTAKALAMALFSTAPTAPDVQFGGPRVKNHNGGAYPFGGVESSPHNHVHVAVGGPRGFMIDPTKAALDPIFWLHHSNIDRLWEVWLRQPGRLNPTETAWLKTVAFRFHDANGKPVRLTAAQVLKTTDLGYRYDGLPPLAQVQPLSTSQGLAAPQKSLARRPMMVGATHTPFTLAAATRQVPLAISAAPAKKNLLATAKGATKVGPEHVLLHLENLVGDHQAGAYDVYLNVPPGEDATEYPTRFVGRISMFGAANTARKSQGHTRDGLSFVLDATEVQRSLSATNEWDPATVQVTFTPVYDWNGTVTVGRVSLNIRQP